MGGTNGGNRGWRPSIENALSFDTANLKRHGYLVEGIERSGVWQWSQNGEPVASASYKLSLGKFAGECVLTYTDGHDETIRCVVPMETTPLPWGGTRWWFLCPYTGKRARKLYKFAAIEKFCHREAIRPLPTYACQRVADGMERVTDQRWRLRHKLGDNVSTLFDAPIKPKGMHWKTFYKYQHRDEALSEKDMALMIDRLAMLSGRFGEAFSAKFAVDLGI